MILMMSFFISVDGAVRSPGNFSFGDGMSLQSALILSGGSDSTIRRKQSRGF